MDITDLLKSQLNPQNLSMLSEMMGINDNKKTENASNAIFSTLLGALTKNASTTQGAEGIFNALSTDHDGSIMSDPLGFILGNKQASNTRSVNGSGIIGHLLGSNIGGVATMISKATGINEGIVQKMMPVLAPMVMGAVGKSMNAAPQQDRSAGMIQGLLTKTVQAEKKSNPMMDMATRFLDQDGDGSIVDDLLGMAGKFFTR